MPPAAAAAAADAAAPPSLRYRLELHHADHDDATIYRFEKGTVLRFYPGASLIGRKVFLYTNYVVTDDGQCDAEFVRSQYYPLEWRRDDDASDGATGATGATGALLDDTDLACELHLRRAGAYHYYFVYDTASCAAGPQGSGWFQVEPELRAGGTPLPLDGVLCQTVLSKCLGPLPRWTRVLRVAHETGYNMVHFTPVQRLGASGSGYSVADQLRVDPRYGGGEREPTFADVENVVSHIRDEWKMLSICDVVLNHTANETEWLQSHPEATYNLRDCPHLRPAALLDAALARLSAEVARGALGPRVPATLCTAHHVDALRPELARRLDELRLHELYQCDAAAVVADFRTRAAARAPPAPGRSAADAGAEPALRLLPDPLRRRRSATVDVELALRLYNAPDAAAADEEARLAACCGRLRGALDALNDEAAAILRDQLAAAVDNCLAGVRYERLEACAGAEPPAVSATRPLVPRYFRWPADAASLQPERAEALAYGEGGELVQAHNGWVMAADPLKDFAARDQDGRVYLRRELIAWGDSVKLRYGSRPEDCPFLWSHMREYVELTAEVFDGLRLDNCHSTPLHVAEYMLDCARNVKPDLYVVAELFTNSDHVDNIFVNRLGITSLIREAQAAWDCRELGRLVHRFGGRAVGALPAAPQGALQDARPRTAHALLLDLTHDNPAPIDKRSVYDYLPTAAVVSMACCATGSTRGYDELVPHHVHVVDEQRQYAEWGAPGTAADAPGVLTGAPGILAAKRALNDLHALLARDGYCEVYVDQMDSDTVAITRQQPATRRAVLLVARTAFVRLDEGGHHHHPPPPSLRFEGDLDEILFEAELVRDTGDGSGGADESTFVRHERYINGLDAYTCSVRRGVPPDASRVFGTLQRDGTHTVLPWRRLPPGAVVALSTRPAPPATAALAALQDVGALAAPAAAAFAALDAADLNALLYRCEAEERAASGGAGGVYDVPGHGPLVYAGLQGAASLLAEVARADDLGHALCANLRQGDWLAEYTWRRLERASGALGAAGAAVRAALQPLRAVPRYLQPAGFAAVHGALHAAAVHAAARRLAAAVTRRPLPRALALTSVQLVGRVFGVELPRFDADAASLSAGLPHFAAGYMRCWGRDTFISLRGLLLLPGRYGVARDHILAYAACLRHGLIPNLLDGGVRARYNCRDAVWWWLYAVRQYCEAAPDGLELLAAPVSRLYPSDEAEPVAPGAAVVPLRDLVQEALDAHFQGRTFRERRAGPEIDAHMTDAGFTVQIGVRPDTGFPFGGSDHNAGTWMDKMGSSARAGNRGRPATPRDGSAVELVGLCYAVVSWLAELHAAGRYPHGGVARAHPDGTATTWTWRQWAARLRDTFERHYWVPAAEGAADQRPDLVHRREIYKDSVGATRAYADYQLRCNYVVAMAVAPELFRPRHAWRALDAVQLHLLAPLGLKTLDPADWAYRPDYNNDDDSADPAVAHGFNYHQGPEWLWPLGFYLRARLRFAECSAAPARVPHDVLRALGPILHELRTSPWRGLPELSNAGGVYCPHSCRSQAWSSAVVLEVLHELHGGGAAP